MYMYGVGECTSVAMSVSFGDDLQCYVTDGFKFDSRLRHDWINTTLTLWVAKKAQLSA